MAQKILIIDDEAIVLDSCTDILQSEPVEVATASDGSLGLDLAHDFGPDLVLLDLKMPGLSGLEVLERLRAWDPSVVVVVITGYATVASAVDAMKEGAYDFVPKPFTPDQLRLVVRRALERRALMLEAGRLRREKEALRENFAAICAHEMKSPLGAVRQNLFVLTRQLAELVDEEQLARLQRMNERIGELIELIETWLHTVSVDIEGIRERFAAVPIVTPIDRAVENVATHAARKDVEISATLPDPSPLVWGDETTLGEAFTNIVGNAVKYSYPGDVVTVTVHRRGGGRVAVEVGDTGVGITEEDQARIFDDFYRGGGGSVEQGAGLGLAIADRIVRAHDGSISVESAPGKGSTFTILLPLMARGGGRDHQTLESTRAPRKEGRT